MRDGSEYFGPYTSGRFAHMLMSLINSLYKLRNCNLQLSPATIAAGKFRVCLEYHIGNCLGPCVGNVSEEEYNEFIVNIRNILKGNVSQVIEFMTGRMKKYATDMQFEKAQFMKESVEALRNYQSKSTIVSTSLNNIDVFLIWKTSAMLI